MIERHLKVYMRDRGAVLSSLVAIFVIIGLYLLFLGNYLESTIVASTGIKNDVFLFVNSWVLSGILVVCPITISLGLFGVKVQDEQNDIFKSFVISPIQKGRIVASYNISAWLISFVITISIYLIWLFIMYMFGYTLLDLKTFFEIVVYIGINIFSASSMTFFIANFIKSSNAFSSISTVVGTLTGFLAGIYLPIGTLPQYVQFIMKLFPPTYSVALIRKQLTEKSLSLITDGDSVKYIQDLKLNLGIDIEVFGHNLNSNMLILIVLISGILFWTGSVIYLKGSQK